MTRETYTNTINFFQRHNLLPPAPKLVDVGCCKGWFTEEFLTFFPDTVPVGVDLDARAQAYYERLSPQARFIHAACSDINGAQEWWMIPGSQDITELGTLVNRNGEHPDLRWVLGGQVRVARLDSLVEQADFIKIDAELMDLHVIAGASRLLLSATPPVAVMFELVSQTRGYTNNAFVHGYLRAFGYRLLIERGDTLALTDSDLGLNVIAVREDKLLASLGFI